MKKIALSGKYGKGKFALVDDEDFERVSQYSWSLSSNGYANRRQWVIPGKVKRTIYLHWEVLSRTPLPGIFTDHVNRKKLDNRRENIRFCLPVQNIINASKRKDNTSGVRGVDRNRGLWRASIMVKRKNLSLGRFENKNDAIQARKKGELKYFGELCV